MANWTVPAVVTMALLGGLPTSASAAPCLEVTLTGTQGGSAVTDGLAGPGTLVRFGDSTRGCADIVLQFDAGRGTAQQLSRVGVGAGDLDAVFLTQALADHAIGLVDLAQLRWRQHNGGETLDIVCASDVAATSGEAMSCEGFVKALGEPLMRSGEVALRRAQNPGLLSGGPSDALNVSTFAPSSEADTVWSMGDVTVQAIGTRQVAGHASYRVDTPAGSVVIGGDAGPDGTEEAPQSSASQELQTFAQGADILVHAAIHPVLGPDGGTTFPQEEYQRRANTVDLGWLAKRAGVETLIYTDLAPPIGASEFASHRLGTPLTEADYRRSAWEAGYGGEVITGRDLFTRRIVRN